MGIATRVNGTAPPDVPLDEIDRASWDFWAQDDDYRDGAALIAEWPERGGGFAHEPGCLSVSLEASGPGRRAIVKPGAAWQGRWP